MRLLLALICALFFVGSAEATDYYVATNGTNNSGCGAVGSPCLTIEYAYEKAAFVAGDTILVQSGTYTGGGTHPTYGRNRLNKHGTAGSPITVKSITRGGAILDGGADATYPNVFFLDGASYNIIDGFVIHNTYRGGISVWSGQNNQVINTEIHHGGTGYAVIGDGGMGLWEDNASSGNYYGSNYIHDNATHGVYLAGDNTVVVNNILSHNGHFGIQVSGDGATSANMKIYNNTSASNSLGGLVLFRDLSGVTIKNNIFYQNVGTAVLVYYATGSGVTIDNNISYGNTSGDIAAYSSTLGYTATNWIHSDPLFIDPGTYNYRLQGGSPAINAGLTLTEATPDYLGVARPQGASYDLGAYESGGCTSPYPTGSFCGDYYQSATAGAFTTLFGTIASEGSGTTPFINYSPFDATLGGATRCGRQNLCAVRWQGNFTFVADNYIFSVTTDDGMRLYIDGTLVIDHFVDQSPTAYTYSTNMTAADHLIKVEYYENTGTAGATVGWARTPPSNEGPVQMTGVATLKGAATLK